MLLLVQRSQLQLNVVNVWFQGTVLHPHSPLPLRNELHRHMRQPTLSPHPLQLPRHMLRSIHCQHKLSKPLSSRHQLEMHTPQLASRSHQSHSLAMVVMVNNHLL